MDTREILNSAVIKDTISRTSGYAHVRFECELKDIPEVHEIHKKNPRAIAEHLDNYKWNFGGRDYSIRKLSNGRLRYSGIIYID